MKKLQEEHNIKVIGIGVGHGAKRVPATYEDHHLVIDDIRKLPRELGDMLTTELRDYDR